MISEEVIVSFALPVALKMAPPQVAVFPLIVEDVMFTVPPRLYIHPPWDSQLVFVVALFVIVDETTFRMPVFETNIAPAWHAFEFDIVIFVKFRVAAVR